mgnify:CR=1 FL=1|tara:strand:- start:563 stop:787 length:225 start_codon:yes stop_codon:yes gene_type:complete
MGKTNQYFFVVENKHRRVSLVQIETTMAKNLEECSVQFSDTEEFKINGLRILYSFDDNFSYYTMSMMPVLKKVI